MLKNFLFIALLLFFGWVYFKYFERKSIYFPTKELGTNPADLGLAYEEIFFKAQDGMDLHGWFVPAKRAKATVLFCHGNAGNVSHHLEGVRIFHDMGISVFIFDYRGYGKSKGHPCETGTYLDGMAAYRYLLSRPEVKKESLIIYGKSLGGAIAIDLAKTVEAAALISESTFTSTADMARELYPFLPLGLFMTIKYDNRSKIQKVTIPKLIIHSLNDEIVPYHHGEELFRLAREPKVFYQMRRGHNDAILLERDEYFKEVGNFLEQYVLRKQEEISPRSDALHDPLSGPR